MIGAELETAKRALPVAAVAGDVDAAGLHLAAALESMTAAMSTYSALDGPEIFVPEVWPPTDDERQRVVARIRTWRDEIVRLDAMAEDARRADAAEARSRNSEFGETPCPSASMPSRLNAHNCQNWCARPANDWRMRNALTRLCLASRLHS